MATDLQRRALRRLQRLRRIYHIAFVTTIAFAVGFCATSGGAHSPVLGVAIVLCFMVGFVTQALVWRTRCPNCREAFFRRVWSLQQTWAGFPTQENCDHCRFNLYRGGNIRREPAR